MHLSRFRIRPLLGGVLTLVLALLSACAKVNDLGLGLVTTKTDAYAIVNGQLLTGTVFLIPDRTGRVALSAEKGRTTSCSGAMRYTGTVIGAIDLHCNDGLKITLDFRMLTETRGYAAGPATEPLATLVFGLPQEEVPAYLAAPAGHQLLVRDPDVGLELL